MMTRAVSVLLLLASVAVAGSPFVDYLAPRGGKLGTEVDVVLTGEWLHDVEAILFLRRGLSVVEIEAVDRKKARVRFAIAGDCPLGEHLFFVRTRTGLSNLAAFWVGVLDEVDEVEGPDPQEIPLDVTVNGLIRREDFDDFVIEVTRRERVSFEVQGARIGSDALDPHLTLSDSEGRVLVEVDDTILGRVDPMGSIVLDPGRYVFRIRDVQANGDPGCHYRFHVGRFPRPLVASPPGFKRGEETTIRFLGDTAALEQTLKIARPARIHSHFVRDEGGMSPTPLKLLTHGMRCFTEKTAPAVLEKIPFAVSGTIAASGEIDEFAFSCGDGVDLRIAGYARTMASPLDPVLEVVDDAGRRVAVADDGMGVDSRLNRSIRKAGRYRIRIRDLHRRGGERFVYRIEVSEARPGRSQRVLPPAGYLSPNVVVPRGGRLVVPFRGSGLEKEKRPRPRIRDLPEGLTARVLPYREDSDVIPVVFEAAADAQLAQSLARVDLFEEVPNKPRRAGFYHSHPLSRVERTLVFESRGMGRMPAVIVDEPGVSISIDTPEVPLVAGGNTSLTVRVVRHEGFEKAPVRLVGAWTPPGISVGKLDVPVGKDEVRLTVSARSDARAATWPLALSALVEREGRTVASSSLFDLRVVERSVAAKAGLARIPRGAAGELRVELDVHEPWEGEATVRILGPPRWMKTAPVRVQSTAAELMLPVSVDRRAPIGARSVYVLVTVPSPDGPLAHRFRTGQVRVEQARPAARAGESR